MSLRPTCLISSLLMVRGALLPLAWCGLSMNGPGSPPSCYARAACRWCDSGSLASSRAILSRDSAHAAVQHRTANADCQSGASDEVHRGGICGKAEEKVCSPWHGSGGGDACRPAPARACEGLLRRERAAAPRSQPNLRQSSALPAREAVIHSPDSSASRRGLRGHSR